MFLIGKIVFKCVQLCLVRFLYGFLVQLLVVLILGFIFAMEPEPPIGVDLKAEEFIYDPEKGIAILLPGREDSLDRLLEHDRQFSALEDEAVEDIVVRAILLEKLRRALRALPTDELRMIDEIFFQERTEREASDKLHLPKTTFRRRMAHILEKLRNMMDENL